MESKLCLFFWLLLLHHQGPSMSSPMPRYGCRTGTPKQCKDAKFVPGHTLLGEGIDIVTMKTTGFNPLDLQEVGENCTLCENIHNQNTWQKLPKAMTDWRPETSCSRNIQSVVSRSIVSVANEATSSVQNDWKVGLSVKFLGVSAKTATGGSHSEMAKFAESKSVTDNYNFLSHKLECARYSFRLVMNPPLKPDFEKSLKDLPDSYDKMTKAKYRQLIDYFGTHYITGVNVGGRTQEVTAVRTCQVTMNGLQMDEVKDCLSVEAEVGIFGTGINSKVELCKNKLKKSGFEGDFHQVFSDRKWEVIGGDAKFDLLAPGKDTSVFNKWMESLNNHPGLVSYSLESLHNLVRIKGPKKENLRLAISDYINDRAITQKCSCPGGQVNSQGNDCSCSCPASKYTSSNCCPTRPGAAELTVTIQYATDLKGDVGSQADAYVKIRFDSSEKRTPMIKNKKNPTWNLDYNFGVVELSPIKKYTIEVWDKDVIHDDFLGKCEKVLISGKTPDTCHLKKGSLTYSISVTCADYLQGPHCQNYRELPPKD
ncbi:perforin-1-like [Rhinoderma darwinii]|uniref:perforin-1-like n=1 Tax=Rhinoderma darwinii TaxID=43563 RepID=UPI003F678AB8